MSALVIMRQIENACARKSPSRHKNKKGALDSIMMNNPLSVTRGKVMSMKRFFITIVCISLLSSLASANYWCDCSLKTPQQWFDAADAVFIAVVISPGKEIRGGATGIFKLTKSLKGKVPADVAVGYDFQGSQAVRLEKGKSYLVYAFGGSDGSGFMTDSCCGTKPLSLAKDDLKAINPEGVNQK